MRKPALRRALQFLFALTFALSTGVHAQSIVGTWQGTLPSGENPRLVFKFTQSDDGLLRGRLGFIDHDSVMVPVLSATFIAPDLSVAMADITYQGKLSADGKSITGIWTRAKQSFPLTLALSSPETLWKYAGSAPSIPMSATADPAFEVATIKPSKPDEKNRSYATRTRQFKATNHTVNELIKFAWQVRDRQIEGTPSWANELRFDIVADPDTAGQPSFDQHRLMLRKLLADRFGLVVHTIHTVFPVYALVVVKSPPKLIRSDPDSKGSSTIYLREQNNGETAVQFAWTTMQELCNILMNFIPDRQIVDETGLTGQFDFTLSISSAILHGGQDSGDIDKSAEFFRAIQPLGFKLVPKREPLEVIVIDHLEKPSPN